MLELFYGGTFDPVHAGHLAIARAARDELGVPVRLVPAADPPHRAPPGADARQRLRMLALATAGEPGLVVDARELHRAERTGQPSYTVDTLLELRAERGAAAPLAWVLGADSLIGLAGWHRWESLFELAHLVVADRPGTDLASRLPEALRARLEGRWVERPEALSARPAGLLWRLGQPLREESASEVRRRIAQGAGWESLLPAEVADYIRAHGLYRAEVS